MGRRTNIPIKVIRPADYGIERYEAKSREPQLREEPLREQSQFDPRFEEPQSGSLAQPEGAQASTDAEPAQIPKPEETVEYWRDQAMRMQADMDNFRKRQKRLSQERIDADRQHMLRAFLSVVDDLERALAVPSGDADGLRQGVELTYRSALQFLKREGVEQIAAENKPFDPNWHEAVATVRHNGASPGLNTVVQVTEPGYRLGDQLLRPAKVIVSV